MLARLLRLLVVAACWPLFCSILAPLDVAAQSYETSGVRVLLQGVSPLEASPERLERLPLVFPERGPVLRESAIIENDPRVPFTQDGLPPFDSRTREEQVPSPYASGFAKDASGTDVFDMTERPARYRFFRDGEWYFSWGANTETWAPTNIHISQPSLGNDVTIHNVRGRDEPGMGGLFESQYNIRLGCFVDADRTVAFEFSFDHTKYTSVLDQTALVTGTVAGAATHANMLLDKDYFNYKLHNGANHILFNLVKRLPLIRPINENLSLSGIGKLGVGFMLPHAENTIMGHDNDVGQKTLSNSVGVHSGWWQLDGWTFGIEAGVRAVLFRPFYLEITDKYAYAGLSDIPIYQGTAKHGLNMNELILSLGMTYDGKHIRTR